MLPPDFHPVLQSWWTSRFAEPTEAQLDGWRAIRRGDDTLIAAPTGSGKTLAAFLFAIDGLLREALEGRLGAETRVVYVSPLRTAAVIFTGDKAWISRRGIARFLWMSADSAFSGET